MFEKIFGDWSVINWIVIFAYLAGTTLLGELLKGKQATIRDFFLGGRKMHWLPVCGSIIATEISAVTFIVVPSLVFAAKGNFTYLQLAIGTILARIIIGIYFVPAFYEKEIYSPYEYMGRKLGPRVDYLTTLIFFAGAILGQSIRVYAIAVVIQVVMGTSLTVSIIIIGVFSILWTFIGGITTVIWTDVIQFAVFVLGGVAALCYIAAGLSGGWGQLFADAASAGKFQLLDLSPDKAYSLWCGLFATVFLTLASHGTDQMMAQRMFCCRNAREASKAIIWSSISLLVTVVMLLVGAGLFVYLQEHSLPARGIQLIGEKVENVFPVFIYYVLPTGISGLLIAAILAAAISSLDSTLAALSQTFVSSFYKPHIRREASERHYLVVSKIAVVVWGVVLSAVAFSAQFLQQFYGDLIQLALSMPSYTYGALLGTFLLALLPLGKDDRGLIWAVPYSVLITFALSWHQSIPRQVVAVALAAVLIYTFYYLPRSEKESGNSAAALVARIALVIAGALIILIISNYRPDGEHFISPPWPWNYPIGTAVALFYGYFLGRDQKRA